MKVCLYGELTKILKGSGIGSAIDHQRKALELNGVEVTRSHRDKFDLIDINTIGPRSAYVAHKMRWKGKPVVMHTHTTAEDLRDSFKFTTQLAPKLRHYLRYFYNQADLLISPSKYTKDVLEDYGVTPEILPVSNGVDMEKFSFNERGRRRYRNKYGLEGVVPFTVGHVFKRKGVLEFLELAREFPDKSFIWYGRVYKDLTSKGVKDSVKNAPDNVTFTGYVRDVNAAFNSGDIFLFPSWCENQGIAILEAAACKMPIVVRNLPTYNGWLDDGVNCLKADDTRDFAEHLQRLLESENLRCKLGDRAYEMAQEHRLERIGEQLKEAYEKLL
ncbi:MAG: glycosyltransferase [Candidatus Altiarchaeales archaeon]|nr:glycosyltransferase [Candidatus Altiarchaeales archaeon]MBD3417206.1 glycosyltransferase [Candidatus Altiarchaeales archaeon]